MKRVNPKRYLTYNNLFDSGNIVVYWMSRDQRCDYNWALLHAQDLAISGNKKLIVIFTLFENYPGANLRHFYFMLKGLSEVELKLKDKNIGLVLLKGNPVSEVLKFTEQHNVSDVVCDFDPLKVKREWQKKLIESVKARVNIVDAHNIIPCWVVSDKEEYNARTFRLKSNRLVHEFLEPFPPVLKMPVENFLNSSINWGFLLSNLACDTSAKPVSAFEPGFNAGERSLNIFIRDRISGYDAFKNNPTKNFTSKLSPYLHFGQLSAQQVVIEILKSGRDDENSKSYIEELVIRRELSDNFCFYNKSYDSITGFKKWAVDTLEEHTKDEREYVYSLEEFENAVTNEYLWNAVQINLKNKGYIHGYLRMYWAKKILEWSKNPEEALKIAITLNDKYSLDGRDPNGYVGCAWSIGGIHDRPWAERPVFGKIRFMNLNGCMRKFDVDLYVSSISQI